MLQISNVGEGKSDWNINETHIIIPMVDGDGTNKETDKILPSSLTLNTLESRDQTILTNALEHSLVIGLDKNLFETPNYKSDLVIIQNSDLKLLSCNGDLKNPVTYTLSYVDQDKSEILWQSPKDRISSNDKAILEVRDVLNYDELEKSEEQISLECIDSDITSQVTKNDEQILPEDTVSVEKKQSPFLNYYSSILDKSNSASVPVLSNLDASKFIQNIKSVENKKLFESTNSEVNDYKLEKGMGRNILSITESVPKINESVPIKLVEFVKNKTEKIEKNVINRNKNDSDETVKTSEEVSNLLSEKSLPLKKKAKMKRTLVTSSSENQRSILKQDVTSVQVNMKCDRKTKKTLALDPLEKQDTYNSGADKPLVNSPGKRRKTMDSNFKKSPKSSSDASIHENKNESKMTDSVGDDGRSKILNSFCFDKTKFSNIFDLVECLRKCRMINATVWQTLNTGLKEMNVDILREINAKMNEEYSKGKLCYSPHLKAFALVLYFKQPAAFNYLSQVYKTGWPSLNVIKEWKQKMNSHQRPEFFKMEKS